MVFGNFQGSETRHRIFWGLIFGPGIFWGFVGSPRDFLEFFLPFDHLRHFNSKTVAPSPNPPPPPSF